MDGDFFKSLRSGKARVVTDHIETVTENGTVLRSGTALNADVIVTATGLKIKFGGDIRFSIADKPIDLSERFVLKSCMLQDVPNTVFAIGYEDSSWTPGADCAAKLLIQLMHELQKNNASAATPHLEAEEEKHMKPKPLFSLFSTHVKDMVRVFPKGSGTGQWRPRSHYMADAWAAKRGDIKTGFVMR